MDELWVGAVDPIGPVWVTDVSARLTGCELFAIPAPRVVDYSRDRFTIWRSTRSDVELYQRVLSGSTGSQRTYLDRERPKMQLHLHLQRAHTRSTCSQTKRRRGD